MQRTLTSWKNWVAGMVMLSACLAGSAFAARPHFLASVAFDSGIANLHLKFNEHTDQIETDWGYRPYADFGGAWHWQSVSAVEELPADDATSEVRYRTRAEGAAYGPNGASAEFAFTMEFSVEELYYIMDEDANYETDPDANRPHNAAVEREDGSTANEAGDEALRPEYPDAILRGAVELTLVGPEPLAVDPERAEFVAHTPVHTNPVCIYPRRAVRSEEVDLVWAARRDVAVYEVLVTSEGKLFRRVFVSGIRHNEADGDVREDGSDLGTPDIDLGRKGHKGYVHRPGGRRAEVARTHIEGLEEGEYEWRVRGFVPGLGSTGWSRPARFTVYLTVPEAPVQVTPENGAVFQVNDPLRYSWEAEEGVDDFFVYVMKDGRHHASRWVKGTVHEAIAEEPGEYAWWVVAWAPAGYSAWSAGSAFTVEGEPSMAPVLETPGHGSSLELNPSEPVVFSWSETAGADWYYIMVGTEEGVVYNNWTQELSDAAILDQAGDYHWHVMAWRPGKHNLWSERGIFSVGAEESVTE